MTGIGVDWAGMMRGRMESERVGESQGDRDDHRAVRQMLPRCVCAI